MRTPAKLPKQHGFSLVEIAIVLIIVGVVATGSILGLGEYRSVQQVKEGGQKMDHLKEQLLLFGQTNKFLPCPDTNFDGFEDRTGAGDLFPCSDDVGTAPYIDLGLQRDDVQDAWGNFIRYAVNSNSDDAAFICDKTSSASYFCKSGFGINWFTFTETPPFLGTPASGVIGGGNYYVCNSIPSVCNNTTVASSINLESESASIVLVAYNQDGYTTLENCLGSTGLNSENCDIDEFYQQGVMTSEEGVFFDDIVRSINGYEIKRTMLGQTIVWDEYPDIVGLGQLTPTYEDFDITSGDTLSEIETIGDDIVFARRNVDTALDLGSGDDYIAIGNDLDSGATLDTGTGNDTVYIVGQANATVLLGEGDDAFILLTDLTQTLNAGTGNDKVWIQGDVLSGAVFTLGSDNDVVWLGKSSDMQPGGLESTVDGGTGYDILVLENMTKTDWDVDAFFQSHVNNFELVLFKADATGAREYIKLP
jgi:prepilin-type N-terminal cleavage/methylation domain-containing protein